jgi:hypothetical protein
MPQRKCVRLAIQKESTNYGGVHTSDADGSLNFRCKEEETWRNRTRGRLLLPFDFLLVGSMLA